MQAIISVLSCANHFEQLYKPITLLREIEQCLKFIEERCIEYAIFSVGFV